MEDDAPLVDHIELLNRVTISFQVKELSLFSFFIYFVTFVRILKFITTNVIYIVYVLYCLELVKSISTLISLTLNPRPQQALRQLKVSCSQGSMASYPFVLNLHGERYSQVSASQTRPQVPRLLKPSKSKCPMNNLLEHQNFFVELHEQFIFRVVLMS